MKSEPSYALPQWPRFLGPPRVTGQLRVQLEDFVVDEVPSQQPSGTGSHLWLQVQKIRANTDWVAGALAQAAGCAARDVGFAGMKDRHAITTQWFSVPCAANAVPPWADWKIPDVRIIQATPHTRKLKRGSLKGNRFSITLRQLKGALDELLPRLETIRKRGLPNYFGPQRFGHNGDNVRRGAHWLFNGGRLSRSKRSIYLSSVRSFLFNQVLAKRVEQGNWDTLLEGDVAMLDGTHSLFLVDPKDGSLHQRCRDFDIHPTGPLPGAAGFLAAGDAAALEKQVLDPYNNLLEALTRARVEADRRSLRLRVTDLQWDLGGDYLNLRFNLPAGAYATTVISELVLTP